MKLTVSQTKKVALLKQHFDDMRRGFNKASALALTRIIKETKLGEAYAEVVDIEDNKNFIVELINLRREAERLLAKRIINGDSVPLSKSKTNDLKYTYSHVEEGDLKALQDKAITHKKPLSLNEIKKLNNKIKQIERAAPKKKKVNKRKPHSYDSLRKRIAANEVTRPYQTDINALIESIKRDPSPIAAAWSVTNVVERGAIALNILSDIEEVIDRLPRRHTLKPSLAVLLGAAKADAEDIVETGKADNMIDLLAYYIQVQGLVACTKYKKVKKA